MSTDLARRVTHDDLPSTQVSEAITQAIEGLKAIRTFIKSEFVRGVDFGTIPGCGDKDTLFLPGAQKALMYFNARPKRSIQRVDLGDGHVEYIITTKLVSRSTKEYLGEGIGCCSTMESKYRFRKAERICPVCGKNAIINGKEEYGGGYLCFAKKGGCGAKFRVGNKQIESQVTGTVENTDLYDVHNTVLKMAKKRCLGGNTPLLVRVSRGVVRTDVEGLWAMRLRSKTNPMFVPGVDGQWRRVVGMTREVHDSVYRINMRDGSYIHASSDHRFPTSRGLLEVGSLREGDSLIRSRIVVRKKGRALGEYGWIAGLYLAEGHQLTKGASVRFTLNVDEMDFAVRIEKAADRLGSRVKISPRSKGDALDVNVYGQAFAGLMDQFIDGRNCYTKHVSRFAFKQGEFFLRKLMEGYLAGDGHDQVRRSAGENRKWILGFTGRNRELAYDLRCIANILDMRIRLGRGKAKAAGIEFPTFTGWIAPKVDSYNQADLELIVGIEKENRQAVLYDIEVDGDHLFCLANGIQTHNSDVDAAMTLGCLSELFTQDIEDTYPMVQVREAGRPDESEPDHVNGEIIEPEAPRQKSAPGLFTNEHIARTDKYLAWIRRQCDRFNLAWHQQWEKSFAEAMADGHAVPAKVVNVMNEWGATGHIVKWAKSCGHIDQSIIPEGLQVRQMAPYATLVFTDHKDELYVELAAYHAQERRQLSDDIYRKFPHLAPEGWIEEQREAAAGMEEEGRPEDESQEERPAPRKKMTKRELAEMTRKEVAAGRLGAATYASPEDHPIPSPYGDGPPPASGAELLAWLKLMHERFDVGIQKCINSWAEIKGFPVRMADWNHHQVAQAHAEAIRKLGELGSRAAADPDRGDAYEGPDAAVANGQTEVG